MDRYLPAASSGIERALGRGAGGGSLDTLNRIATAGQRFRQIGGPSSFTGSRWSGLKGLGGGDPFAGGWSRSSFGRRTADIANRFPEFFGGLSTSSTTEPWMQQQQSPVGGNYPGVSVAGGNWAALDAHNAEIQNAAARYGAPANLIKALINRESSGDWARDGNRPTWLADRNQYILPFVGITQAAAASWGLDFWGMVGNKQAQINGMATILAGLAQQYGGYDNAVKVYFGGPAALTTGFTDENGMTSSYYYNTAVRDWHNLDAQMGLTSQVGPTSGPGMGSAPSGGGNASALVQSAYNYLGSPYVWATAGPNTFDCSGFVYFLLNQQGQDLPYSARSSHWQYGNLGTPVQANQIQPGDLLFYNTTGEYREGNYAGHVGIYVGNGQMINALNPGAGVVVSNINDQYWTSRYLGARRAGGVNTGASAVSQPGTIPSGGPTASVANLYNAYNAGWRP